MKLSLDEAVSLYERAMFPRAKKFQAETLNNKQLAFAPEAPIGLMTGMLRTAARDSPSLFMKLLGSAPVIATVFSFFWIKTQIGWAVRKFWRRTRNLPGS